MAKCGKEVNNYSLHSSSWKHYPNAKTIRLKRNAMSVCIIYQAKPKLTLILCKFTYTLLVSWHTVISQNNIPTLNENVQTSTL